MIDGISNGRGSRRVEGGRRPRIFPPTAHYLVLLPSRTNSDCSSLESRFLFGGQRCPVKV